MKTVLSFLLAGALTAASLSAQTLTWTQRNTGVTAGLQYTAAAYGAGKYAVTAYGSGTTSGTFQSQVATSADGVTWSVATLPTAPVVRGITYGGGLWVIPAERNGTDSANTQNILTSPDGTTWTARTTGPGTLSKIAHITTASGANLFVAGGLTTNSPTRSNLAYSADAVTWTRTNLGGNDARITYLAAGAGTVIAATQNGGQVHRSNDGATWTAVSLPSTTTTNYIVGLVYAGGEFIVAAQVDGGAARLFTSSDGSTWTARGSASPATPASVTITGLGASGAASAGSRVIAAGNSTNFTTFEGASYIFHTVGNLNTWTTQQLGSGDFANNNFAFFANNLWLVGNNKTQLFTTTDTAGGSSTGGGSTGGGSTGGGSTGGGSTGGGSTGGGNTATNPGRLINLSVLTTLSSATDEFTLGYVIGGTGTTGAKPLVIRAAGPSLGALGVPGTIADPQLETFAGSTRTGGNDNWGGASALAADLAAVGAFAYTGPTSRDAAVSTSISSRDNSVKVTGVAGATGQVIAEVYDATPTASFAATTPRLLNVSVRKHLGTGITAGFVLGGGAPTKVLIRVVGPGLAAFGVGGTVVDPQLALFNDKSVKIGENNDWGGSADLTAAFTSVGAFALPGATSKDAALLVTLQPGLYSVQATGVNNTTGVGIVEVYELP